MMNIMSAISKVAQLSKIIKNPKQAVNMALDVLQKQNPQAAQMIKNAIKSGKNPIEFAKEQAANGNLTEKNFDDLKQYYGLAKQMGLPSIPEKDWNDIKNAIKAKDRRNIDNNSNDFNGF